MKYTVSLILLLYSMNIYSSEWYLVNGGAIETNMDLDNVEKIMWVYIFENSNRKFKPKESYGYQYKAINETTIKINALCNMDNRSKTNIHNEFYMVFDGGSCFFQLNYDFKSGEFHRLSVNGEA